MTDTVNLGLPCIEGSQAQKHVTHNDALRILDTLVQLAVADRDLTAPPGSPAEGQRWIVKASATGAWAGHDNAIAAWQDGGWQFSAPRTGWCAFVADEGALVIWNGTAWSDLFAVIGSIQNLIHLGVGAAADDTNPLSAKLNNALFVAKTVAEGGDGNLRYKLSKESAANTLSFLLQDNYSGRAEIGLTGDDDFHFKVSADGATWNEGIVIARNTGAVSFPNTSIGAGGRVLLAADRTYYVRTDGSDSNNGLADNAADAFLTIQKAIDTVASLDLSTYIVTIQVGSGTYTQALTLKQTIGAAAPILKGNTASPGNVIISPASGNAITLAEFATWRVQGFKLAAAGGAGIAVTGPCKCLVDGAMEFGACGASQMAAGRGGYLNVIANFSISGSAAYHLNIGSQGICLVEGGITVTLAGTPSFSGAFVAASGAAFLRATGTTYSGSATGVRYSGTGNAVIETGGGGANFFPGNSAGSTATGAQYS